MNLNKQAKRENNISLFQQVFRFGVVGCYAAAVHIATLIFVVHALQLQPLLANVFAFLTAFAASYLGHHHWTFASSNARYRQALPRFFLIKALTFGINEGIYFIFLDRLQMNYITAIILTLAIVAVITFISGKLWAFRRQERHPNREFR